MGIFVMGSIFLDGSDLLFQFGNFWLRISLCCLRCRFFQWFGDWARWLTSGGVKLFCFSGVYCTFEKSYMRQATVYQREPLIAAAKKEFLRVTRGGFDIPFEFRFGSTIEPSGDMVGIACENYVIPSAWRNDRFTTEKSFSYITVIKEERAI
jgi:hypothetical protein